MLTAPYLDLSDVPANINTDDDLSIPDMYTVPLPDGTFWVLWDFFNPDVSDFALRLARRFDSDGEPITDAILRPSGLPGTDFLNVTQVADDTFKFAFIDAANVGFSVSSVVVDQNLDGDADKTILATFELEGTFTKIAVGFLESNKIATASFDSDTDQIFVSVAQRGATTSNAVMLETTAGSSFIRLEVIPATDGGFKVVWSSIDPGGTTTSLHARDFTADGVALGETELLATDGPPLLNPPDLDLVELAAGGWALTYGDNLLIFDDEANLTTSHLDIRALDNQNSDNLTSVPLDDGGLILFWNAWSFNSVDREVVYQRFDNLGNAVSEPVLYQTFSTATIELAPLLLSSGDVALNLSFRESGPVFPSSVQIIRPTADVVNGTDSDDVISGGVRALVSDGGAGNDELSGTGEVDLLQGGAGNDDIFGGAGSDSLDGGTGNDDLTGGLGADVIDGGDGNDRAFYIDSDETVLIDLRDATFVGGTAEGDVVTNVEEFFGSRFADNLFGSVDSDTMRGQRGSDNLRGRGGNDFLFGGDGNDQLLGGLGNDQLFGEAGNDTLVGSDGNDRLTGGLGADTLDGGDGFDRVLYTDSDASVLIDVRDGTFSGGTAEGDTILNIENFFGSRFADNFFGSTGDDTLHGQRGADNLRGRAGDDELFGDDGNDTLIGGGGDDVLVGGANKDTFVFAGTWGDDVITDYTDGEDRFDFSSSGLSFNDLTISQVNADTLIEDAFGNSIKLQNTTATDVTEADFLF